MIDQPTFCRLELLTENGWQVAHHGINLLHPDKYPERLAKNGKTGRVVIIETGEIINAGLTSCPYCDAPHAGPQDGTCLI